MECLEVMQNLEQRKMTLLLLSLSLFLLMTENQARLENACRIGIELVVNS